ncbi:tyrosinase central domain containing protein [Nitzschia inconspicua]|uniref:Tyrosinase central domain containing protein n=1 Tax=Nitzschia inconspicua TaxID=303405 RepID=A0A9K3LRN8_9STRA|nr:tyrosinase central domain containing protein [Nitzschia inconspicua]
MRLGPAQLLFVLGGATTPVIARDCRTSWRRAWRDLTCEEQDDFLQVIVDMKVDGIYDEFVWLHNEVALQTHYTVEFLPWHRWFTWQFEKAMQEFTGRCIYIPYWDWERDSGREWASHVFHEDTLGTWSGTRLQNGRQCTADGIASSFGTPFQSSMSETGQSCLERVFLSGFSFSGEAEVLALITNYDQYADTVPGQQDGMNGFRVDYEAGPHLLVHGIVGGQMESHFSVADPLFWLHHSNVDRHYSLWQDYQDHDLLDKEDYRHPWQYDGNLDQTLTYWAASQVSHDFRMRFDDGSLGYPTVREVLSFDSDLMSVRYMNDRLASMIPGYEPNGRLFEAATRNTDGVRCNRNSWRELQKQETGADNELDDQTLITKNSLRGQMTTAENFLKTNPSTCEQMNQFTQPEDREEWDRLCREMPENTTVAERFALLAEANCQRRGNPRKDELHLQMHMMMERSIKPEAFECFHRPDKPL